MSNNLPVFKDNGKFTTLSQFFETIVKSYLEDYQTKTEVLPNTQFGFKRSRWTIAHIGQRKWLTGVQKGNVIEVLGLDLSLT
ncbi:Hypothetical protein FKW44_022060 [Caligus rogercresseyi]|uniref:Uncharacterized protein n=1 Tax=Caligus rogercresseyi TaxID=217165 RepID=A0A7T8GSA9_CALRO|nr:Hypothetical protein FKW44_022060 [Caligus rogercresseyi]